MANSTNHRLQVSVTTFEMQYGIRDLSIRHLSFAFVIRISPFVSRFRLAYNSTSMAYNSLKRIFGETKLELKLLFLFGVGLLVIIVTAFWWYGSNTAKLVYEQNRNTAQLVLQEHMVATHLGADKIQSNRPGSFPLPRKRSRTERQWIELQKKTVQQACGRSRDGSGRTSIPERSRPRRTEDEAEICKKFLSEPPEPSKPDEPETTEYDGTDRRAASIATSSRSAPETTCLTMLPCPAAWAARASTPWVRSAFRWPAASPRRARQLCSRAT